MLLIASSLILDTEKIIKSSLVSSVLEDVCLYIPVRPEDILTCKLTVLSNRLSTSSAKGIVKILADIFKQEKKLAADF